jgi:hypothetical protein
MLHRSSLWILFCASMIGSGLATTGYGTTCPWDLDNVPDLHTTHLEVRVSFKNAVPATVSVLCKLMDKSEWKAQSPVNGQREFRWTLAPENFVCVKKTGGAPIHFAMVQDVDVTWDNETKNPGTVALKWTGNDGVVLPWETDPKPRAEEKGLTWWPGVDHNNAGHFAWRYEPNGLLINNVNFSCIERSWYYFKPGRDRESFQFNFGIPGAAKSEIKVVAENQRLHDGMAGLQWRLEDPADQGLYARDKIQADWTTFRWKRNVKTRGGKAYDQELRYSAQAVGIQVQTDSPVFELSFQDAKATRGPVSIVLPDGRAARIVSRPAGLDPARMKDNWLVFLAGDGMPEIPVMVVFQYRPERIEWTENHLVIVRKAGVGTLAVGTPFGVAVQDANTAAVWSSVPGKVPMPRLKAFANLLAAYPWTCEESFAVSGDWVHVRNRLAFLPWTDDWGTRPVGYTPLPPFIPYDVDHGFVPRECVRDVINLHVPTKWGPYFARKGASLDYKLPIPRAWDLFVLGTAPNGKNKWLYDRLMGSMTKEIIEKQFAGGVGPTYYPHYVAHDFSAGALRAANFLPDDLRNRLCDLTRARARNALFPQEYRYRRDPITGARCVGCTYTWGAQSAANSEGAVDVDYWQGLTIYGLYTHAKYTRDWDTMRTYWPRIRAMLSYWEALHSWALMGPGAREAGEIYGGDMATAGYAGLVGFYRLAARVGSPYQRDLGAYLLAKNAVPRLAAFSFMDWCPQMQHQELRWGKICAGFGELWVASLKSLSTDVKDMSAKDPWWASGIIGPQSAQFEYLDLIASAARRDAIRWEEAFRTMCPNKGMQGQNAGNVIPHMIFRTYLSEDLCRDAFDFLKGWQGTYMLRDVHAIAAMLAWDCPVRLIDWSPAYVESARWDDAAKTADIRVDAGKTEAIIQLAVNRPSPRVSMDGSPVPVKMAGEWNSWKEIRVTVPAGRHTVAVR